MLIHTDAPLASVSRRFASVSLHFAYVFLFSGAARLLLLLDEIGMDLVNQGIKFRFRKLSIFEPITDNIKIFHSDVTQLVALLGRDAPKCLNPSV